MLLKHTTTIRFIFGLATVFIVICTIPIVYSAQSTPQTSKERVKKRDFDAATSIACAQIQNEALGVCTAKIAYGIDGDATVVVRFANDFERTLYFNDGGFIRANATMSGVGTDTDWKTVEGVHHIRVDDQRFEIPVEFITGEIK